MSQGILGVVDFGAGLPGAMSSAAVSSRLLQSTLGDYSLALGDHYCLGMRRTVVEPWQQRTPSSSAESGTVAVIHGEYHNYPDLRQEVRPEAVSCEGDLDLALLLYRREGVKFARRLNGLFAFAIIDEREKTCVLVNDRFGMAHQIYWTVAGGRLCFATHLKVLFKLADIRREVDSEGLNLFLKNSYVPSPWSMFKNVQKLPPAHYLILRNNTLEMAEYSGFKGVMTEMDLDEATARYETLLKNSISRRIASQGGNALLLSGGLDSSTNVALAAQCTDKPLHTVSIGFENPQIDERPFARIVAKQFQTQHHEYVITGNEIEALPRLIWHLEEPNFELGLFLCYVALSGATQYAKTIIGGEGSDQLFGTGGFVGGRPVAVYYLLAKSGLMSPVRSLQPVFDHPYFSEHDNFAFKVRLFWNRATDLNDWFSHGFDEHQLRLLHKLPGAARVPSVFPEISSRGKSFAEFYRDALIQQDVRHFINQNLMVKWGRLANMLDLTLRESYLDAEVTDFLSSLEHRFRRSGGLLHQLAGKAKSKLLHRKLAASLLPPEIVRKPKQGGFVPVMIFLRNPALRQKIYANLLNSEAIREHFRPEYVRSLCDDYEAAERRPLGWPSFRNYKANQILFLLTFDIWHHFFVANAPYTESMSLSDYLRESTSPPKSLSRASGASGT